MDYSDNFGWMRSQHLLTAPCSGPPRRPQRREFTVHMSEICYCYFWLIKLTIGRRLPMRAKQQSYCLPIVRAGSIDQQNFLNAYNQNLCLLLKQSPTHQRSTLAKNALSLISGRHSQVPTLLLPDLISGIAFSHLSHIHLPWPLPQHPKHLRAGVS